MKTKQLLKSDDTGIDIPVTIAKAQVFRNVRSDELTLKKENGGKKW